MGQWSSFGSGPLSNLPPKNSTSEFINLSTDKLNIAAITPNQFIQAKGNDATKSLRLVETILLMAARDQISWLVDKVMTRFSSTI
jgi:hypothetical protein